MKILRLICGDSFVRVAIKNSLFSCLIYREADSLEVGVRTALVIERTSP